MRVDPAAQVAATPSTTAPAGSRETGKTLLPRRVVAREFSRLFADKGIAAHPADVRQLAARFCATGRPLADVEAVVLAYADPTGETAVRNVMREGGGRRAD